MRFLVFGTNQQLHKSLQQLHWAGKFWYLISFQRSSDPSYLKLGAQFSSPATISCNFIETYISYWSLPDIQLSYQSKIYTRYMFTLSKLKIWYWYLPLPDIYIYINGTSNIISTRHVFTILTFVAFWPSMPSMKPCHLATLSVHLHPKLLMSVVETKVAPTKCCHGPET